MTALLKTRKRKTLALLLVALVTLAAATWCLWPRPFYGRGRVKVIVTETVLCAKDPGYVERTLDCGDDFRHAAYVARRDGKDIFVWNGVEGRPYDEIRAVSAVSPDGTRYAYGARRGDKWLMVIDGAETGEYDGVMPFAETLVTGSGVLTSAALWVRAASCVVWSGDSRRLAWTALRDGRAFVVRDGVEGPAFEAILGGKTVMSPDGSRLAYVARRGDKCVLVIDGRETGGEYDVVDAPWFDPQGHCCASARDAAGQTVIVDRVDTPVVHLARAGDGRLAHAARLHDGRMAVVVDGKPVATYDELAFGLRFDDAARLTYAAGRDGRWYVVRDDTELGPYDAVEGPEFITEAGGAFAYRVLRDGKRYFVLDGVEHPMPDGFAYAVSGPGGRVASVVTGYRRSFVVVDGRRWRPMSECSQERFSPDGRHFACVAEEYVGPLRKRIGGLRRSLGLVSPAQLLIGASAQFLLVDNVPSRCYRWFMQPFFTADSRHFISIAYGRDGHVLLIDGRETDYLKPYGNRVFLCRQAGDSYVFVASRDNNFVRVEMTFESLD